MVLLSDMSRLTCPGPWIMLRPASPKELPLGFAQVLVDAGVRPPGETGVQKAAVLNHSAVVGLLKETGALVTFARSDPLTPRLMSNELPSTRGVKYKPLATVKFPLHCQLSRMCDHAPLRAKVLFSPKGKS